MQIESDEDKLLKLNSFDVSKVLTKKIIVKTLGESIGGRVKYNRGFKECFKETNFKLNFSLDSFSICPLCCNGFERGVLPNHLEHCRLH